MIRKLLLFAFLPLFSFTALFGKQVDMEKVRLVAENYIEAKMQLRNSDNKNIQLVYTAQNSESLRNSDIQKTVYYYVFNIGENNGFVVISGDDVARPVLGYVDSGEYDASNLPPNFIYWMDCLRQEIVYAIEKELTAGEEIQSQWRIYLSENMDELRSSNESVVLPLLSTKWDQGNPYNLLCPSYNSGGKQMKSLTGCVATAMAQIMKYYEYPSKGIGSSSQYTTDKEKILIPSLDYEINYDWKNMLDVYTASSPTINQNAVATLMYHCGVSVTMDYNSISSGAPSFMAMLALENRFGYQKGIKHELRASHTSQNWNTLIKNELDCKRPVLYAGKNASDGAHAFVCDGYDASGLFHFNWGWGGSYDGYFATGALNPTKSNGYNYNQDIYFKIQPPGIEPEPYNMKLALGKTFSASKNSVSWGEIFSVSAWFANIGKGDFKGTLGIALTDNNGKILEIIGTTNSTAYTLLAGLTGYQSQTIYCAVSKDIPAGTYKISAAVKSLDKDWITIAKQDEGQSSTMSLLVGKDIIEDNTNIMLYNKALKIVPETIVEGGPVEIFFTIRNSISARCVADVDMGFYSLSGELMQLIGSNRFFFNSPVSSSIATSKVTVPPGKYKLAMYAKGVNGERKLIESDGYYYQNNIDVIVTKSSTSVDNAKQNENSVFLNPAGNILHFHFDESDQIVKHIRIVDIFGRPIRQKIMNQTFGQIDILLDNVPPGTYLLEILTDEERNVYKFIKK